jgi:hypothetical protein
MSSGSEKMKTTIRYADYVETHHHDFLNAVQKARNVTIDNSSYSEYSDISLIDAFFGTGYTLSSFPSLYDIYGKFMAGLDIDSLYSQLFEDTVNAPEVNNLVSAESALINDDIEETAIPRLQLGIRDINSVMSSSFVVGKSLIESARVKVVEKFRADLKYRLIPVVKERWTAHLDWNKNVVCTYAEILKFYISSKIDVDEVNYAFAARNRLWPFTVLEYERAAVGALQGAITTTSDTGGSSKTSKVIGGALTGAATGAMVGNTIAPATATTSGGAGWGAGVGTALGIAAALTY